MAETEGSDDTSENELLDKSLSFWKGGIHKERFEPIPLDLHTASSLGQYESVKMYIIRKETDIDKRNRGGWTPLMYACYIGHDNIVNLLLEAGVNVNIRNHKGETPLMLASSCGNESVGYFLLHQEAEIEAKDERGWTALFHATYSGHQNMVRFLLEHGANMNAVERSMGMTPFMEAAAEGHEIIVQLFLQNGVDVNTRAYNGDTARSLALMHGNMKIVSLIDNHVMPITSLRAEPGLDTDLASSDNTLFRNRRGPPGGGPSIMDGPAAIARLIDRTKDTTTQPKQAQSLVPKGYVTFPESDSASNEVEGLSNREVTSPINPEDCSGSRDFFDNEDDTNAFSKTGALTIKSSSGSSGGLAGIFGIGGREESLDSEDFPHESSCEDSHRHGYSGESSSDEGVDEPSEPAKEVSETLKVKCGISEGNEDVADTDNTNEAKEKMLVGKEKRKLRNRKSKENLTTEKVNEIEVLKNSVSEWVDSVNHAQPIPQSDLYTEDSPHTQPIQQDIVYKPEAGVVQTNQQTDLYMPHSGQTQSIQQSNLYTNTSDKMQQNPQSNLYVTDGDHVQTDQQTAPHTRQSGQFSNESEKPVFEAETAGLDQSALKPEYQNKPTVVNRTSNHYTFPSSHHETSSQPVVKHFTKSDLFDQVAENVKQNMSMNQFMPNGEHEQGTTEGMVKATIPPVSALNLLNTSSSTVPVSSYYKGQDETERVGAVQNPNFYKAQNYNGVNHPPFTLPQGQGHMANYLPASHQKQDMPLANPTNPTRYSPSQAGIPVQPPPGFSPQFSPYQMFPQVTTSTLPHVYSSSVTTAPKSTPPSTQADEQTKDPPSPSSNTLFMDKMKDSQATDLPTLLEQLGLTKHLPTFVEQDVDLQVFLTLSDSDLKEIGIKLFGPRKKMTNAIARWHSKARISVGELEQAYADRLAGELQEMNSQLQVAFEQLDTLKAQIAQEQQLRNVTETCLMEERAAWSQVQRVIMDTRQQCEDFKDALKKLKIYSNELKSRVPADSAQPQPKRPIRGAGAMRDEQMQDRGIVTYDKLPTDTVVRKMDAYLQETHHLLGTITMNTDRLLGRNTQSQSADSGYS